MSSTVVDLLNERYKKGFSKVVEDTYFRLQEDQAAINPYMPLVSYPDPELAVAKIRDYPMIGSVVGEDQEVPNRKSNGNIRVYDLGEIRIAMGFTYKSSDLKIAEKFRRMLQMGAASGAETYLEYFFKRGSRLAESLQNTHTLLTLKVLATGGCTYNDPITGAQLNFTYPDLVSGHFPSALTSTARWSQSSTATGIADLVSWTRTFYDTTGRYPDAWLMSTITWRQLQSQAATKRRVIAYRTGRETTQNANVDGVVVNLSEINTLLSLQEEPVPPIVLYDAEYEQENADGTFTKQRYLEQHKVVALVRGNTERALLPFVENDNRPGIFVENKVIETMPRKEVSRAMTCGFPLVADTRYLFGVTVDDT